MSWSFKQIIYALILFVVISILANYLINELFLNYLRIHYSSCIRFVIWYGAFFILFLCLYLFYKFKKTDRLYSSVFLIYPIVNVLAYKYHIIQSKYSCDIVHFCNRLTGLLAEYSYIVVIIFFSYTIKDKRLLLGLPLFLILEVYLYHLIT